MKRRNVPQKKEQEKIQIKTNETKITNLPDKELKETGIRILKKPESKVRNSEGTSTNN